MVGTLLALVLALTLGPVGIHETLDFQLVGPEATLVVESVCTVILVVHRQGAVRVHTREVMRLDRRRLRDANPSSADQPGQESPSARDVETSVRRPGPATSGPPAADSGRDVQYDGAVSGAAHPGVADARSGRGRPGEQLGGIGVSVGHTR